MDTPITARQNPEIAQAWTLQSFKCDMWKLFCFTVSRYENRQTLRLLQREQAQYWIGHEPTIRIQLLSVTFLSLPFQAIYWSINCNLTTVTAEKFNKLAQEL